MPHDRTLRFRVTVRGIGSRAQRRDNTDRWQDLGPSTLVIPAVAIRAANGSVH